MKIQFFGIVTDCDCRNAAGRQSLRVQSMCGLSPQIIGARSDLEAAGHIIDLLDAIRCSKREGIVLANVAPRNGCQKQWPNGTPFCYTYVGQALLVSTLAGHTLSLVKKLRLAETLYVLDIPTVMKWAVRKRLISISEAEHTVATQFRSFEFLPRVALWIAGRWKVPAQKMQVQEVVPDAPLAVWYIDDPFGNCKTTVLEHERNRTRFSDLAFCKRLADVPSKDLSWVVGSSGYGNQRWLELVVNGESAAKKLDVGIGNLLIR
ncbi:MAG: SAM hydroxide adenosyltransferase [Patescibacteria group bacterium]